MTEQIEQSQGPCQGQASLSDATSVLSSALETLVERITSKSELPKVTPEKFSGDLFQYPYWRQSFNALVENDATSMSQKLVHLSRSTSGEVHDAIKGLLSLNTQHAYKEALRLLDKRYGDPFLVAQACKEKIKSWPVIKPGNGKELRKFSDHLE